MSFCNYKARHDATHAVSPGAAARRWVQQAIGVGLLSIADLKAAEASCTRRGVAEVGGKTVNPSTRLSERPESPCEPTSEGT